MPPPLEVHVFHASAASWRWCCSSPSRRRSWSTRTRRWRWSPACGWPWGPLAGDDSLEGFGLGLLPLICELLNKLLCLLGDAVDVAGIGVVDKLFGTYQRTLIFSEVKDFLCGIQSIIEPVVYCELHVIGQDIDKHKA